MIVPLYIYGVYNTQSTFLLSILCFSAGYIVSIIFDRCNKMASNPTNKIIRNISYEDDSNDDFSTESNNDQKIVAVPSRDFLTTPAVRTQAMNNAFHNEFTGFYAGEIKIEKITPHLLQWDAQEDIKLSSHLGQMYPKLNISNELLEIFKCTIKQMVECFKTYVGGEFEKETTVFASTINMMNPETGQRVIAFDDFGKEFIGNPGYLQAARWWMALYGARDRDEDKIGRYESEWMKKCGLTYISFEENTGLSKIAKNRINNVTKNACHKIMKATGFSINKSCKMVTDPKTGIRKQSKRRIKGVFKKEFVKPWNNYAGDTVGMRLEDYVEFRKKNKLPVGDDFNGDSIAIDWFYQSAIDSQKNQILKIKVSYKERKTRVMFVFTKFFLNSFHVL
jgi:hypothetical protein